MSEKKYPIAEVFTSPQGEGLYAGMLMTFIRFAGCSVGKKIAVAEREDAAQLDPDFGKHIPLPVYTEKCTTYDGRHFLCDTNFQTKQTMTVEEILQWIPPSVTHVCLTGGEPLDQPLEPLMDALASKDLKIHIETSGTVDIAERACPKIAIGPFGFQGWMWITVSPKMGVLPKMISIADEIKLLVDHAFDIANVPQQIMEHPLVWIQPINHEYTIDEKNMELCLELQKNNPNWRISTQSHKLWNVR